MMELWGRVMSENSNSVISLYYSNLDNCEYPEMVYYRAIKNLKSYNIYLERAVQLLKSQTLKLNWIEVLKDKKEEEEAVSLEKEDEDIEVDEFQDDKDNKDQVLHNTNEQKDDTEGIWVKLIETNPDEPYRTFLEFFKAKKVFDTKRPIGKGIRVLKNYSRNNEIKLSHRPAGETIYLPPSIHPLLRQINAINNLQLNPDPQHRSLLRLVEILDVADWPLFSNIRIREDDWFILKDNSIPGNDEQRKFVIKALSTSDFAILEGPPGSGKTTAICEFILQAIKRNKRILLCASTHVAVDNVLERLVDNYNNIVIPVRIGDSYNISEQIRGYQYGQFKKTEKDRLIKFLLNEKRKNKELLDSQEELLRSLQEGDKGTIEDLILESANLICGTTIGILNYPPIREMGRRKSGSKKPVPQFDYLIIDEASKTTFQEFLVPALFAKRWILSGDPKQLSPYVDEKEISANVDTVLRDHIDKEICLDIFNCYKSKLWRMNKRNILISYQNQKTREKYKIQANTLGLEVYEVESNWKEIIDEMELELNILASQVILCDSNTLHDIEHLLPPDIEFIRGDYLSIDKRSYKVNKNFIHFPEPVDFKMPIISTMPKFTRRRNYWKKEQYYKKSEKRKQRAEDNWADSITWRLSRSFSLRNIKNQSLIDNYEREIDLLLPKWLKIKNKDKEKNDSEEKNGDESKYRYTIRRLNYIRQIALPSIIEVLREGFPKRFQYYTETTLTEGFPSDDLKRRHVLLSYQHRMHSEISKFPREQFYDEKSLKDNLNLDQIRESEWKYSKYDHKVVWKNVNGKVHYRYNQNEVEANELIKELKRFLSWAKKNPKIIKETSGTQIIPWEVAILTFYRPQELLLREKLRETLKDYRSYQTFKTDNVKITLCTVDRFQGHEADMVLLSFVQVNYIGFLDSPNRLNVALTRAKNQLIMFGFHNYFASNRHRSDILRNLANETKHALKVG